MAGNSSAVASSTAISGHWLETSSEEFDSVRFQLIIALSSIQQQCQGCVVEKVAIWKIENPEVQYKYERRSSGMLRMNSWISGDANSMFAENTLESVCSRGFVTSSSAAGGITFTTGIINIPNKESSFTAEHSFLMLEMAVGRSHVFDGEAKASAIPAGFDSLYIPPQSLDRNKDGKFSLQEYQSAAEFDNRDCTQYCHKYFIKDPNQLCPKYIVRFRLQRLKGYRFPDSSGLDLKLIDPISLKTANELSSGRNNFDSPAVIEKRLVPVEKVFAQAAADMQYSDSDTSLQSKKQWIGKQLANIEEKVREINLNYADIVDAIDEAAAKAKAKLQDIVRSKLEMCLSMEIELRRQTEQLQWIDWSINSELDKCQSSLSSIPLGSEDSKRKVMLEFLKLWKQHSLVRNAIVRSKPTEMQALGSIHGDIRFQSDLRIFTDPFYEQQKLQNQGVSNEYSNGAKGADKIGSSGTFVGEYAYRMNNTNLHSSLSLTSHNYIDPSIQAAINQEIETIQLLSLQQQLEGQSGALRLPASITRPAIAGASHPVSLHAILDILKSDETKPENTLDPNNKESEEYLKQAFTAGLPLALGLDSNYQESASLAEGGKKQNQMSLDELSVHSAPDEASDGIHMSLPQLQQFAAQFKQFKLSDQSNRKMKQLKARYDPSESESSYNALLKSRIILPEETRTLYFSLPIFSKPPIIKLIYSTAEHRRGLDELYSRIMKNRYPVLIVIRSGQYRFGSYLSHPPLPTSGWSGSPSCFLFSLTLDLKVPFSARHVLGDSALKEPMALLAQPNRIFFGNGDLTLDNTLQKGTSELENSYGVGVEMHSPEAMCLLAGRPCFNVQDVEVWTINTNV